MSTDPHNLTVIFHRSDLPGELDFVIAGFDTSHFVTPIQMGHRLLIEEDELEVTAITQRIPLRGHEEEGGYLAVEARFAYDPGYTPQEVIDQLARFAYLDNPRREGSEPEPHHGPCPTCDQLRVMRKTDLS